MGAGTTGLVFRAHDPVEGRLVAIKAFRLDLTPERAAELAHALQALSARDLSHPSIAAPIAAGVEDGIAWFAQAYVPAESLDSALRQYGPPPVSDALTIVTQLAGALDFAAATGVLHGSLHPRDVLVAPGETHLVDLGVAGALEACGVRAPVRRPYSAPERSAGRPLSRAGDIFALGAIAFELLSGQPVTGAGDDVIVTLPDVPGSNREALLETFSFALALAPDERYATALAFAAPLKRALADALTRPAAPRKRRTTRPPEGLLAIGGFETEPAPDSATASVPVIERPADPLTVGGSDRSERATGSVSSRDTLRAPVTPAHSDEQEPTVRVRPARRAARDAGRGESIDDAASAQLPQPTEPEPSAPAGEPIAAPGEADPMRAEARDVRYASLDGGDSRSPLDAVEVNGPAKPIDWWERPQEAPPEGPSRAALGAALPEQHYPAGPEPDDIGPDAQAFAAVPYDAFEPPAGDYGNVDGAALDYTPGVPARAPWLGLAAMLLVGLVAGLAGGWFLFGGRGDRSSAGAPASTSAAGTSKTPAREWTDDSVRPPGGTPSTTSPAATASSVKPPRPTPLPGRVPESAPAAAAAAPRTETAPRGRVVVRTRPAGARVEIGGRSRGESPATVSDLAYGQHVVRVSRQGYVTEQRRVTLSARQPAQTVDVTLKRNAPSAPARPAREVERFVGTLVVDSRPVGAKVFLDGKGLGVTPLSVPDVGVGLHVVRLEMSGYRRWSTSVRVVAGERERVAASLEEETGTMNAVLALEDGTWFRGTAAGAQGEARGEVVFNTSMTGYQEVLTDPSYAGQIVTMTSPQIGNYGVSEADIESSGPRVAGFIMRESSPVASNWRAETTLREYLIRHGIVAIADIDTRALTRKLRSSGVMRGVIATGPADPAELVQHAREIPLMEGTDLVQAVTCDAPHEWLATTLEEAGEFGVPPERRASRRLRIAAYDFGIKQNILRRLAQHNCDVTVFPASVPAGDLLAIEPDGVFLSNGPGDPAAVPYAIDNVRVLLDTDVPMFGICLGHQVLGLAMGGRTYKLKFGHRGANHPVKFLDSGQVEITSQNHGFAVDPDSLPASAHVTHLNLYDGTVEGLRHTDKPVFSVQYHPEASPGPHDADYLFRQFLDEIERR